MITISFTATPEISKEEISNIAAAVTCNLQFYFGFDVKIEDKLITEIIDNVNGETFEQRLDAIVEKTEICVKLE